MNKLINLIIIIATLGTVATCRSKSGEQPSQPVDSRYKKTGSVERLSPELDRIIDSSEKPEIIAGGFEWTEGPLWLPGQDMLIFSDIPNNAIYQWTEKDSIKLYLKPAGFTDTSSRREGEEGSNGLLLDPSGRLVLCQHGDRRMARMEAPLDHPEPVFTTLTDKYNGKRLNSPNDAVFNSHGDLFFTDPPYGLEKGFDDPARELNFTGVFRLSSDGKLTLITDKLSAPNGVALSTDEKKLYVSNSGDGEQAFLMEYELNENGSTSEGRVFMRPKGEGHMDGLKVRGDGIIFTTGPGGVLILTPDGKHLGTILTGQATSNCALDESGNYLYITADDFLMRIRLK
ncbi:MAG TPA: SMP-30/gluconolactonase/LRE family protein [Bacteroidales bacterium]|nr:SMP-30/gluconolactonase/LRE family protein [Bacteroidales bacterium]